jgi:hypothetical protein
MEASTHIGRSKTANAAQAGVALVMTLITISVLAILLLGFLSTMLIERRAAGAFEDTQRAKLVAQGAVSHAIDILRTNIPEPARLAESPLTAPGENWVVNPGRLTLIDESGARQFIPLHTGEVTETPDPLGPRDAESVDLNQPLPGQPIPAITGKPENASEPRPPMRVKWVNLVRDPSRPAGPENRLNGRYAFWVDDENARINFNVALGKPDPETGKFGDQLRARFLTPTFTRGDSTVNASGSGHRDWALGRPQSVNLDSLFDHPSQLRHDKLLAHTFLHGFNRYPEAIMDFIDVPSARDWYTRNQFNLTFYNRSPEFNAFGRSRFFTTYIPLSLEAGPSYQHPFVYDPSGAYAGNASEVLHLNSLLGTFGFTSTVEDDDGGGKVAGGNVINRAQVDMLLGYLQRRWPGYTGTFFDKYGEAECRQIALNAVLMARMATTMIGSNLIAFSRDWGMRSTSVNYAPESDELPGNTPERFYWRFKVSNRAKLMLPQTPGPHVTEVRLFAKAVPADPPPKGNPAELSGFARPHYVQYWYEVEYYMHPVGPVVDLSEFPIRMDYLELTVTGGARSKRQQFGPTDPSDNRAARNWNQASNLGRLQIHPAPGTTLGPAGVLFQGVTVPNRRVVRSVIRTVGQRETVIPQEVDGNLSDWDPFIFDAAKNPSVTLAVKFRPGMGIANAPGRPRQMIPLGEYAADTLKAQFTVNLLQPGREQAFSWQINDPRLSGNLGAWEEKRKGPDLPSRVGTPELPNENEPAEEASERSKYRYVQRAPADTTIAGYPVDRPDEYNTRGRTASPGYWSLLHTGMQSNKPWQTLNLGEEASQSSPPDWLLLDLFGGTYPMAHDQWKIDSTLPDEFSTASFMNSTAGQVNINTRIYPQNQFFKVPERDKPLAAVFWNLRTPGAIKGLVENVRAYQSDEQLFDYVGEIANVPAFSAGGTQWEAESLLRNMTGSLTTRSNTFGVWGVAQVVKKARRNEQHDRFERGDAVRAEKRFYALIERYIWAGRDGVPGNAHADHGGKWDRIAEQTAPITVADGATDTLFQLPGSPPLVRAANQARLNLDPSGAYPEFDGPERVGTNKYTQAALGRIQYRPSSLEDAYNPPQPVIKYRVAYFKYLDQ